MTGLKKLFGPLVLLIFLGFSTMMVSAQTDSAVLKKVEALTASVASLQKTLEGVVAKQAQTADMPPYTLSPQEKLYVFLPIVLFLVLFFEIVRRLRSNGFDFAKAMEGDQPIIIQKENPAAISNPATQPPTISVSQTGPNGTPVMPKSSSRLLAFFSGMAALTVALCLVSYYVYFGIRGKAAPNMDGLLEAVLGLGIGVVPYAVNKMTQPGK